MTATKDILDFAARPHVLPETTRGNAVRLLADSLAVGAAGANSPEAQKLLLAVKGWGQGDDARLLSDGSRVSTSSAAFFNGFAIHCLEWDAVHEAAVVHALSVVTAALLAASDRMKHNDPDAFLTALTVGVDIASGLGISASGPMKFFRPATAGIIGAALAVARLEGLEREQYDDVLGLAYSQISGTMQAHVEASIALPLQIANAARGAITAVDLVKAGMNGPHDGLEGQFGYGALIEDIDLSRYTKSIVQKWLIDEVSVKPFPSGRASHGGLGALSDICLAQKIELSDVHSIQLYAPPLIHRLVGRTYQADMSASYARLCFAALAPMMIRDGYINPSLFSAEGLQASELITLAQNTQVIVDDNPDENALAPQRIVLELKNGQLIERNITANLGSPDAPMNDGQSHQKYDLCRRLSDNKTDLRIFDNPLEYVSNLK